MRGASRARLFADRRQPFRRAQGGERCRTTQRPEPGEGHPAVAGLAVGIGLELACLVEVGERVTRLRFDSFGDVAR